MGAGGGERSSAAAYSRWLERYREKSNAMGGCSCEGRMSCTAGDVVLRDGGGALNPLQAHGGST